MEIGEKKIFDKDAAYERWDQKNQRRGNDKYFHEEEREESYLRELKGRIQNNTSGFLRVVLTALIVLAQVCIVIVFSLQIIKNGTIWYYLIQVFSMAAIVALINRNQSPS